MLKGKKFNAFALSRLRHTLFLIRHFLVKGAYLLCYYYYLKLNTLFSTIKVC